MKLPRFRVGTAHQKRRAGMAVPEWIIHGLVLGTLATLAGLIVAGIII